MIIDQYSFDDWVINTDDSRWSAWQFCYKNNFDQNNHKVPNMLNADPNINMWRENQHPHQQVG